jgi:potassium-transporting ATPase KdpC subunit
MRRTALAALRLMLVMTLLLGLAYPLAVTVIGQITYRDRANGSLIERDGRVVGSSLLGQRFSGARWFHGRPDADDPRASGASNLGPSNPELGSAIRERVAAVRLADGADAAIPVDAVTASGSGLDPDITPAYARLQAPRVAAARGLALGDVVALISSHTTGRTLGVLGEPRVNVLGLNLALEALASRP